MSVTKTMYVKENSFRKLDDPLFQLSTCLILISLIQ